MRSSFVRTALTAGASFISLLTASACGDSAPVESNGGESAGDARDGGSRACTREGATSSCTCSSGDDGSRTCRNGKYSSCVCSEDDDDDDDDDTRTPRQPKCKAGYYTGSFKGKYRPGAFGFGVLPSGFEVDIEGGKSLFDDSLPPLAFTLTEESTGPDGEFSTFTVGGGCMQGLATAVLITQSPFVARLTGNLDCETGRFQGELEGYYALIGIPGANFTFRGPLSAEFQLERSALEQGVWKVDEPPSLSGAPAGGGNGTWDAKYTADFAPKREVDPCSTIISGGDGGVTMIGPGAPTTAADAGSLKALPPTSSLDGGVASR